MGRLRFRLSTAWCAVVVVLTAAVVLVVALPATAAPPGPNSPSGLLVTPTFVDTGGQSNDCQLFGSPATSEYSFRIANPKSQAYPGQLSDGTPFTITLTVASNGNRKDKFFDFAISSGVVASDVGVKGGSQTARYNYLGTPTFQLIGADTSLHATLDNQNNLYNLSNVTFCLTKAPVPATISGRVFGDDNANGSFDSGTESGIPGTLVSVYPAAGGPAIATATTNGTGLYAVSDPDVLTGSSYKVCAVSPTGAFTWAQTLPAGLTNCTVPPEFPVGPVVAVTGNTTGVDIGAQKQASISGTVFNDADNDHAFDSGEGTAGWRVNLYKDGVFLSFATSAGDGGYTFPALPAASSYRVCVMPPNSTWTQTFPTSSSVTCSGTGEFTKGYAYTPLATNQTNVTNFGGAVLANVSGSVYYDTNQSHVKDGPDTNLEWRVNLYQGSVLIDNKTSVGGAYQFTGLPLGNYRVCVVPGSGRWTQTEPQQLDPNATCASTYGGILELPKGIAFTLTAGGKINQNFGNVQIANISGTIFKDTTDQFGNFDRALGPGEGPYTGAATVYLLDGSNTAVANVTTSNGSYTFSDVAAGTYTVCLGSPISGYGLDLPFAGTAGSAACPTASYFYRGYAVTLGVSDSSGSDFGILQAGPCTGFPFPFPRYVVKFAGGICKEGQVFSSAYDDTGKKLAEITPLRTDLAKVPLIEKITWSIPTDNRRQLTIIYDDVPPYSVPGAQAMAFCNFDPRDHAASDDISLLPAYYPIGTSGLILPAGQTSCLIEVHALVDGPAHSGQSDYVFYVYSAIDGWRSTP